MSVWIWPPTSDWWSAWSHWPIYIPLYPQQVYMPLQQPSSMRPGIPQSLSSICSNWCPISLMPSTAQLLTRSCMGELVSSSVSCLLRSTWDRSFVSSLVWLLPWGRCSMLLSSRGKTTAVPVQGLLPSVANTWLHTFWIWLYPHQGCKQAVHCTS